PGGASLPCFGPAPCEEPGASLPGVAAAGWRSSLPGAEPAWPTSAGTSAGAAATVGAVSLEAAGTAAASRPTTASSGAIDGLTWLDGTAAVARPLLVTR